MLAGGGGGGGWSLCQPDRKKEIASEEVRQRAQEVPMA